MENPYAAVYKALGPAVSCEGAMLGCLHKASNHFIQELSGKEISRYALRYVFKDSDGPLEQQLLKNWCIVSDYGHHIPISWCWRSDWLQNPESRWHHGWLHILEWGAFVCPDDIIGVGCSEVVESSYFIKDAVPGSSIVEFFKEYWSSVKATCPLAFRQRKLMRRVERKNKRNKGTKPCIISLP